MAARFIKLIQCFNQVLFRSRLIHLESMSPSHPLKSFHVGMDNSLCPAFLFGHMEDQSWNSYVTTTILVELREARGGGFTRPTHRCLLQLRRYLHRLVQQQWHHRVKTSRCYHCRCSLKNCRHLSLARLHLWCKVAVVLHYNLQTVLQTSLQSVSPIRYPCKCADVHQIQI